MTERFLFLLGSGRPGGNTEGLARLAATELGAEVEQKWVRLADLPLAPFRDLRHEGDGTYPQPVGDELVLLEATLAATDLVIASPLYWYSVSTSVKLYLDYWTAWMRVPGLNFVERMRGKTMWAVTAHTASNVSDADPLLGTLRLSADYLGMRWGGELLAYGSRPGEAVAGEGVPAATRQLFAARALTGS